MLELNRYLEIPLPEDVEKAKWCGDFDRALRLIHRKLSEGETALCRQEAAGAGGAHPPPAASGLPLQRGGRPGPAPGAHSRLYPGRAAGAGGQRRHRLDLHPGQAPLQQQLLRHPGEGLPGHRPAGRAAPCRREQGAQAPVRHGEEAGGDRFRRLQDPAAGPPPGGRQRLPPRGAPAGPPAHPRPGGKYGEHPDPGVLSPAGPHRSGDRRPAHGVLFLRPSGEPPVHRGVPI